MSRCEYFLLWWATCDALECSVMKCALTRAVGIPVFYDVWEWSCVFIIIQRNHPSLIVMWCIALTAYADRATPVARLIDLSGCAFLDCHVLGFFYVMDEDGGIRKSSMRVSFLPCLVRAMSDTEKARCIYYSLQQFTRPGRTTMNPSLW